jgi:hypothetical protein
VGIVAVLERTAPPVVLLTMRLRRCTPLRLLYCFAVLLFTLRQVNGIFFFASPHSALIFFNTVANNLYLTTTTKLAESLIRDFLRILMPLH